MLADAVFAETYRLTRNRLQVFLSVLLTPILFAVGGVIFHVLSKSKGDEAAAAAGLPAMPSTEPVNLGEVFMFAANQSANGLAMVFMLVTAATIYAGDYRWETWRLVTPRNDRISLLLGKVGLIKLLSLAMSLVFLLAVVVYFVAQAVVYQRPLSFSVEMAELGKAAVVWLLSYVRIIQFTMVALLTAVLTRSLLAALFVPWALGFAQTILGQLMPLFGWDSSMWAPLLLLPGLDYDILKTAVQPGLTQVPVAAGAVLKALIGFSLWTIVPLIGAIAWFRRQDLSKE